MSAEATPPGVARSEPVQQHLILGDANVLLSERFGLEAEVAREAIAVDNIIIRVPFILD